MFKTKLKPREINYVLGIPLYDNCPGPILMPLVKNIKDPESFFKLAGGGAKRREPPESAIFREIWEETGIFDVAFPSLKTGEITTIEEDGSKHIQECFAIHVYSLDSLHKEPKEDGNELLIVGMFPVLYIREVITNDMIVDIGKATNYKDLLDYPNVNNSKILPPHIGFIREGFKKIFEWE